MHIILVIFAIDKNTHIHIWICGWESTMKFWQFVFPSIETPSSSSSLIFALVFYDFDSYSFSFVFVYVFVFVL